MSLRTISMSDTIAITAPDLCWRNDEAALIDVKRNRAPKDIAVFIILCSPEEQATVENQLRSPPNVGRSPNLMVGR